MFKISTTSSVISTQDKLNTTKTQKTTFDNATNERRNTFANLKPLATKIINAFAVSGAVTLAIADAKTVKQGTSSKKSTTEETNTENARATNSISTSQQSYDRLLNRPFRQPHTSTRAKPKNYITIFAS